MKKFNPKFLFATKKYYTELALLLRQRPGRTALPCPLTTSLHTRSIVLYFIWRKRRKREKWGRKRGSKLCWKLSRRMYRYIIIRDVNLSRMYQSFRIVDLRVTLHVMQSTHVSYSLRVSFTTLHRGQNPCVGRN